MLEIINTFRERTFGPIASVSIHKEDEGCRVFGKCERTVGSQQEDIIACRVATMGEVTRVRPHISGKDGEDCTLYTPRIPSFSLCVCIVFLHSYVHNMCRCVYLCATTCLFLFVCLLCRNVCMFACVWVYSCLLLCSQHCVHKMNHLPHKSKELTEAFSCG